MIQSSNKKQVSAEDVLNSDALVVIFLLLNYTLQAQSLQGNNLSGCFLLSLDNLNILFLHYSRFYVYHSGCVFHYAYSYIQLFWCITMITLKDNGCHNQFAFYCFRESLFIQQYRVYERIATNIIKHKCINNNILCTYLYLSMRSLASSNFELDTTTVLLSVTQKKCFNLPINVLWSHLGLSMSKCW